MKLGEKYWKTLTKRQKAEYFKEYYLTWSLCILAITLLVIYLCVKIAYKDKTILYVACVDNVLEEGEKESLESSLEHKISKGKKHTSVTIDDSFNTTEDGVHKLEVYLNSHGVDLIVAEEDTYKGLAAYGFLQQIDKVIDVNALGMKPEKLLYTPGYKENNEISFEDKETGKGEVYPYGIRLEGYESYSRLGASLKHPIIGCASNAKNIENAKKILQSMARESK